MKRALQGLHACQPLSALIIQGRLEITSASGHLLLQWTDHRPSHPAGMAAWGPHQDLNHQHHVNCSPRPPVALQSTKTVHPAGGDGGDVNHQHHPVYELAAGDEDDDVYETDSEDEEEAEVGWA